MTHDYHLPPEVRALVSLPERPRLLIVDDQPINIQTLNQIFQADYEVFMATSGQRALDFCRHNTPPDLILLDVVMPGMDGLEVCRQLKSSPATAATPERNWRCSTTSWVSWRRTWKRRCAACCCSLPTMPLPA